MSGVNILLTALVTSYFSDGDFAYKVYNNVKYDALL